MPIFALILPVTCDDDDSWVRSWTWLVARRVLLSPHRPG